MIFSTHVSRLQVQCSLYYIMWVRVMDLYPGSSAIDLWPMGNRMLREHRGKKELQRKFVEDLTCESGF